MIILVLCKAIISLIETYEFIEDFNYACKIQSLFNFGQ